MNRKEWNFQQKLPHKFECKLCSYFLVSAAFGAIIKEGYTFKRKITKAFMNKSPIASVFTCWVNHVKPASIESFNETLCKRFWGHFIFPERLFAQELFMRKEEILFQNLYRRKWKKIKLLKSVGFVTNHFLEKKTINLQIIVS